MDKNERVQNPVNPEHPPVTVEMALKMLAELLIGLRSDFQRVSGEIGELQRAVSVLEGRIHERDHGHT